MATTHDPIRQTVAARVEARGLSLSAASCAIGRNPAYLQQYLTRRSPRRLGEDERLRLAMLLDVDERELGAREPWSPPAVTEADLPY